MAVFPLTRRVVSFTIPTVFIESRQSTQGQTCGRYSESHHGTEKEVRKRDNITFPEVKVEVLELEKATKIGVTEDVI